MNKVGAFVCAAGLLVASCCSATLMDVSGYGQVKVVPNNAILGVTFQNKDKSVSNAQSNVAVRVSKFMRILNLPELNVSQEKVKSTNFNIQPAYDYGYGSTPTLSGYNVIHSFQVVLDKVDLAATVIDRLVQYLGDTVQVDYVQFVVSDVAEAQKKANELAVENLKEQVHELLANLGCKNEAVVTRISMNSPISSAPVAPSPMMEDAKMMRGVAASVPQQFVVGTDTASATVFAQVSVPSSCAV